MGRSKTNNETTIPPQPKTILKLYHPKIDYAAIKVKYSTPKEYLESIDHLAKTITDFGRENGKLVPFLIENNDQVFLINCSNLYIVGYQNLNKQERDKEKLVIFKEEKLRYHDNKKEYQLKDIKNNQDSTIENLHILGYMISEALRSLLIKEYIADHFCKINIKNNIFDHKIDADRNDKSYDICRDILKKLSIEEIAHSFKKSNKDTIKNYIVQLQKLTINPNDKSELIKNIEDLNLSQLQGLPYYADSKTPQDGTYIFSKHIDGQGELLGYDLFIHD